MPATKLEMIKKAVHCPHVELEEAIEGPTSLYQDSVLLISQWKPKYFSVKKNILDLRFCHVE